jgi:hypothetical protein
MRVTFGDQFEDLQGPASSCLDEPPSFAPALGWALDYARVRRDEKMAIARFPLEHGVSSLAA